MRGIKIMVAIVSSVVCFPTDGRGDEFVAINNHRAIFKSEAHAQRPQLPALFFGSIHASSFLYSSKFVQNLSDGYEFQLEYRFYNPSKLFLSLLISQEGELTLARGQRSEQYYSAMLL